MKRARLLTSGMVIDCGLDSLLDSLLDYVGFGCKRVCGLYMWALIV